MYPEQWSAESNTSEAGLLRKARHEYNVKLQPVQVKRFENDGSTWAESFTKLFAFNQTQYQRVISLDSDATVLQSMDELFFLPRAPVAMPRAYWIDDIFSTQIVVIEPSALEFERIQHAFEHRTMIEFDMEIMNKLYSQNCLILPHRRYDLVTGEFRSKEHDRYLGSSNEVWDARKVLEEVSYLHFSDWPYPKPWSEYSDVTHAKLQPPCQESFQGEEDCSTRDVWNEIYLDFMQRRQEVCGSRFMPD
ncbi:nucleotide-diphospho-sugar transferase [Aureobasidium pullulans]|uniref:Nucleotide-diphospho-sugar transferase n=1 Tax=Aureobasidium pullulans TaxID=5580 RepID=A0A4S9WA10_AURPU|nr:nucleotide-diphospho-sugar transferase [Aureobasidium pullulans]THZ61117.1 nucleotide-diphospho-sugar transferase [Aureobasidium pullulans]